MKSESILKVSAFALAALAAHAADIYVATTGNDTTGDGSAAAPFATFSKALETASAQGGDTIHVGPGLYEITAQLEVTKPVTIIGTNGRDATEVRRVGVLTTKVNDIERCLYMNHASASVSGITFSGGRIYNSNGSETDDCMGAGVLIGTAGGTLADCAITNCVIGRSGVFGGGLAIRSASGIVRRTAITDNHCGLNAPGSIDGWTTYGAGVFMAGGLLEDCVVARNDDMSQNAHSGCGLYVKGNAVVRRTAVTDNTIYRAESGGTGCAGAGIFCAGAARIESCLFARNRNNRGQGGAAYVNAAAIFSNCTFVANLSYAAGGIFSNNNRARFLYGLFQDNLTTCDASATAPEWGGNASTVFSNCLSTVAFTASSLECTTGRAVFSDGDYGLSPLSDRLDCGWKPLDAETPAADFARTGDTCVAGLPTAFSAAALPAAATRLFRWRVDGGEWGAYSADASFSTTFASSGNHAVAMQAKVNGAELAAIEMTLYVAPATITVNGGDLAAALVPAGDGTVVHVGRGVYSVSGQINITNAVLVVADEGPEVTEIRRVTTSKPTSLNASIPRPFLQRAVFIDHPRAELRGFAVSGGWNYEDRTTYDHMNAGSGVLIGPRGGTLSGSIVTNCGCASSIKCGAVALLCRAALVTNCVIAKNTMKTWNVWAGGVLLAGGGRITHSTIRDNDIAANNQGYGAGVCSWGGYISHCRITGNTINRDPGGAGIYTASADTFADNCLIDGNIGSSQNSTVSGGGVYGTAGTFVNCTIVGNSAMQGGGIYGTSANLKFFNCLVQGNTATADSTAGAPEWNGAKTCFDHCLSPVALPETGSGNQTSSATFETGSIYRLAAGSNGFDQGDLSAYPAIAAGTDFDGGTRVWGGSADIGCFEYASDKSFEVSITPPVNVPLCGNDATFSASAVNPLGLSLTFSWTIDGEPAGNGATLETSFAAPGNHAVALSATDGNETDTAEIVFYVAPTDLFVVSLDEVPGQMPVFPYNTWAGAATNLADAVAAAESGSTVHLSNGVHMVTGEIALEKAIRIVGDCGAAATVIRRSAVTRLYYAAQELRHRVLSINHPGACVEGVAIVNGFLGDQQAKGAGVLIGALGGTLRDCIVSNNYMYMNMATYGAGIHMSGGLVERCVICCNTNATQSQDSVFGGGVVVAGGVLRDSTIMRNSLFYNVGNNKPTTAIGGGAGVAVGNGVMINCLVRENVSEGAVGGVELVGKAFITNCTSVANSSVTASLPCGIHARASHPYFATGNAVNSAFLGNVSGESVFEADAALTFSHCFAPEGALPSGDGNVSGDASAFTDFNGGDFTPRRNSPLHNKGLYDASWMDDATDLAGNPRVDHYKGARGLVDIGCYEAPYVPDATVILLR
jgi:hypothetical protein